jgi:predicted glycosyltransferase
MPSLTRPPVVLVAPLNWGLGHATRCIPLIRELLSKGCKVIVASDGASHALLVEEFPEVTHISSPHTEIRYSKSPRWFGWAMIKLLPRFWLQIKREQRWIRSIVDAYQIEAIISDNRYGMAHPAIASVLITHQLGIQTGYGKQVDRWIQKVLYRFIDQYQSVWVPDVKEDPSLAGTLSHPVSYPTIPVEYVGMLNRFSRSNPKATTSSKEDRSVLVLLSGPEPQRTLLEKLILKQAASFNGSLIIVRGLPAVVNAQTAANTDQQHLQELYGIPRVRQFDHLAATELQNLLQGVDYIVCRSGYTTLMEMIPLQKKLLLIPTPGQPEQQYLASYADQQRYAPFWSQDRFSLVAALEEASRYPYHFPDLLNKNALGQVVSSLLESLRNKAVHSD